MEEGGEAISWRGVLKKKNKKIVETQGFVGASFIAFREKRTVAGTKSPFATG